MKTTVFVPRKEVKKIVPLYDKKKKTYSIYVNEEFIEIDEKTFNNLFQRKDDFFKERRAEDIAESMAESDEFIDAINSLKKTLGEDLTKDDFVELAKEEMLENGNPFLGLEYDLQEIEDNDDEQEASKFVEKVASQIFDNYIGN